MKWRNAIDLLGNILSSSREQPSLTTGLFSVVKARTKGRRGSRSPISILQKPNIVLFSACVVEDPVQLQLPCQIQASMDRKKMVHGG
mmetsp:Transcript_40383/g.59898  ORF Transcript_40383/g.59898 Transcript_40383/m.59898 type:complete len:87 (+) Transcript_40383:368-628(+)